MIAVECYFDTLLVQCCSVKRRDIKHESGKGRVIARLVNDESYTLGLIDADPGSVQPRELSTFVEEEVVSPSLKLLKKGRCKRLIVISPRLEDWILSRAAMVGVSANEFSLPDNFRDLHGLGQRIGSNPKHRKFVEELINRDSEVRQFRDWLSKYISSE